jgi:general secretion pathway protein D
MRRFFAARTRLAACFLAFAVVLLAQPALAASTLSAIRLDAIPTGGAIVSVTFAGGVPSYHVVGAGTSEVAVLFDNATLGPQVPPNVAGAGPITSLSIAQTGTSGSVALHLAAADGVTVRVGGSIVFINVASVHPDANQFGLLPPPPPSSAVGQITELIPLKYADVSEVAGVLVAGSTVASNDTFVPQSSSLGTNSLSGGSSFGGITGSFSQPAQAQSFGGNPFGQSQGLGQRVNENIAIDRRLNAIILSGTPEVIAPLRELIEKLDVPVQSVILETQIVELDDSAARNIGIDLSPDGTGAIVEAAGQTTGSGGALRTGSVTQFGANLAANLYAQVTAGNAKIIAKPRILAQSGQQASILTGDAIPIVTNVVVAGAGAVSSQQVNYVNVGVNLQIQPRVSSDGYVTSHIYSEVSSVTQFINGIPQISQRTANTTATVRDGEAFVVGGLLQDNEIRNLSKLPFIGDLPLIGLLFQHISTSRSQTNLYIVVTPHIVGLPGVTPSTPPLAIPTSLPQVGAPAAPQAPSASTPPLTAPSSNPAPRPTP